METLQQKIESMCNVIPSVKESIREALEENGIVENDKLDVILPALKKALEITRADNGTYNVALVANGKILRNEETEIPITIADFVHDYNFVGLPDGVTGIPYDESMSLSNEDIEAVANGTKVILPPKKDKTAKNAISSMDGKTMSRNVEDIASGKTQVDMSK